MAPSDPSDRPPRLTLVALRLPIPWDEFGFPSPWSAAATVMQDGAVGWAWSGEPPDFAIPSCEPATAQRVEGWDLDHVVLLVPDLPAAVDLARAVGCEPRLRMEVRGRPTAFFRVGPVLEMIQSPVRAPALFGAALVSEESLEVVALRWRAGGIDVTDPRPAIQPGRRIMTVRGLDAGLAVMSPDRAVAAP